jgi:uncharacterized protein DUF4238
MTIIRRQHLIPQFLLRNWTDEKGGFLRYLNWQDAIKNSTPKRSAYITNFYDSESEYQPNEKRFTDIENEIKPILDKIVNEKKISIISESEKFLLSAFILLQQKRTLRGRYQSTAHLRSKIDAGIRQIDIKDEKILRKEHMAELFSSSNLPNIIRVFNLKWMLIENSTECGFFLSENPVILSNTYANQEKYLESIYLYNLHFQDFTSFSIRAIFPLSPQFLLLLHDPTLKDEYNDIADMGKGEIKSIEQIFGLNCETFFHSFNYTFLRSKDERFLKDHKEFVFKKGTCFEIKKFTDGFSAKIPFTQLQQEIFVEYALGNDIMKFIQGWTKFAIRQRNQKLLIEISFNSQHIQHRKVSISNILTDLKKVKKAMQTGNFSKISENLDLFQEKIEYMLKNLLVNIGTIQFVKFCQDSFENNQKKFLFQLELFKQPQITESIRKTKPDIRNIIFWHEAIKRRIVF